MHSIRLCAKKFVVFFVVSAVAAAAPSIDSMVLLLLLRDFIINFYEHVVLFNTL